MGHVPWTDGGLFFTYPKKKDEADGIVVKTNGDLDKTGAELRGVGGGGGGSNYGPVLPSAGGRGPVPGGVTLPGAVGQCGFRILTQTSDP